MSYLSERINVASIASRATPTVVAALDQDITDYYNTTSHPGYETRPQYLRFARRVRACLLDQLSILVRSFPVEDSVKDAVVVRFIELDAGDAEYDHETNTISLHMDYLARIVKQLYSILQDYEDRDLTKIRSTILSQRSMIVQQIADMVEVLAHEFVHTIQFKRSQIGDYGYRSYTMRDKNKFWDHINAGNLDAHYFASPNEIGAYAHQHATKLLGEIKQNASNVDQLKQVNQLIAKINRSGTHYQNMDQFPKTTQHLIKKKFLTLVYKELDDYRQELQTIVNKNAQRRKNQ